MTTSTCFQTENHILFNLWYSYKFLHCLFNYVGCTCHTSALHMSLLTSPWPLSVCYLITHYPWTPGQCDVYAARVTFHRFPQVLIYWLTQQKIKMLKSWVSWTATCQVGIWTQVMERSYSCSPFVLYSAYFSPFLSVSQFLSYSLEGCQISELYITIGWMPDCTPFSSVRVVYCYTL